MDDGDSRQRRAFRDETLVVVRAAVGRALASDHAAFATAVKLLYKVCNVYLDAQPSPPMSMAAHAAAAADVAAQNAPMAVTWALRHG